MDRIVANALKTLRLVPRATLILMVLAAPVLAVTMRADAGSTIEAPALRKTGVGFVLLVSLRRG